jgi:hypothetical protein
MLRRELKEMRKRPGRPTLSQIERWLDEYEIDYRDAAVVRKAKRAIAPAASAAQIE